MTRQADLLAALNDEPQITVEKLAARIDVAPDTCRKELRKLKEEGRIAGPQYVVKPYAFMLVKVSPVASTRAEVVKTIRAANVGDVTYVSGDNVMCLVVVRVPVESKKYKTLIDKLIDIDGVDPVTLTVIGV